MKEARSNNEVMVVGTIMGEFKCISDTEKTYATSISIERKSGVKDIIPVRTTENELSHEMLDKGIIGQKVKIQGELRSAMELGEDNKKHLRIYIHPNEFELVHPYTEDISKVFLRGYICKPTIYRKTLRGKEITDIFIATHRLDGESDYIPCIAWWRNARWSAHLSVGDNVKIEGQIQSREYLKDLDTKIAYEVSVFDIRK